MCFSAVFSRRLDSSFSLSGLPGENGFYEKSRRQTVMSISSNAMFASKYLTLRSVKFNFSLASFQILMEGCLTEDSAGGLVAVSDGELPDEEDGELSELSEIRYFIIDLAVAQCGNYGNSLFFAKIS